MSEKTKELTNVQLKAVEKTKKLLYEIYGQLIPASKKGEFSVLESMTGLIKKHHLSTPTIKSLQLCGVIKKHPKFRKFYQWTLMDAGGRPSDVNISSAAVDVVITSAELQRISSDEREKRTGVRYTSKYVPVAERKKGKKKKRKYTKRAETTTANESTQRFSGKLPIEKYQTTGQDLEALSDQLIGLIAQTSMDRIFSGKKATSTIKLPLGGSLICTFE